MCVEVPPSPLSLGSAVQPRDVDVLGRKALLRGLRLALSAGAVLEFDALMDDWKTTRSRGAASSGVIAGLARARHRPEHHPAQLVRSLDAKDDLDDDSASFESVEVVEGSQPQAAGHRLVSRGLETV